MTSSPRNRLTISFSGGETSGFMTYGILTGLIPTPKQYDDIVVTFANTGEENPETLEFVNLCDWLLGFNTVWLEAIQFPGERRGPSFRVVTFESASRNGGPFESSIAKYGIPNMRFKDCTRNLKTRPMEAYLRDGCRWEKGSFDTAIGIRADEIDRMSSEAEKFNLVYPLISWRPTTKPEVNTWWNTMPFRLRLKGYQGNCKTCWKKSRRKHYTILSQNPEHYEFYERMESLYSMVGPEFAKPGLPEGYKRTFFRGNCTVEDLKQEFISVRDVFVPAPDDANVYVPMDAILDMGGGCEESCEAFSDEDMTHTDDESGGDV